MSNIGYELPDWYKKQPAALGDFGSTIKRCMPIFDVMTSGYMLVLPCDIYIDSTDPKGLTFFAPPDIMEDFQDRLFASHLEAQYIEYPTKPETYHKQLLRIDPFYAVGTEKGYSSLFTQPFHWDPNPLQVLFILFFRPELILIAVNKRASSLCSLVS